MAEPRRPATPIEKLAAALDASPPTGSREGGAEGFKLERGPAILEVSLTRGASACLVIRAHEEEPAPSSGYRKNVLLRHRARLVYPSLLVRRVTSLDRVNMLLALRFEVRTGDAAFDGEVAIEGGPSDEVIAQTFGSKPARDAVLDIVRAGFTLQLEERAIRAELASPSEAHLGATSVTPVIDALATLVGQVPRADPSAFTPRPQAGRVLTGAIVAVGLIAAGALAPGTLDDPGVPVREVPRPLFSIPTLIPGVALGAGLFVLSYFLVRWQLKRRNTSTDLPILLALFVVTATLGVGLLDASNRLLDEESAIEVHDVKVTKKDTGKSRKSGMTNEWFLVVPSWRPGVKELELSVSEDLFGHTRAGDALRVTVHPGFWGWEWGAVVDRAAGGAARPDDGGDPQRDIRPVPSGRPSPDAPADFP
jgi:hypothetical protein